jgi:hypothetical protein
MAMSSFCAPTTQLTLVVATRARSQRWTAADPLAFDQSPCSMTIRMFNPASDCLTPANRSRAADV